MAEQPKKTSGFVLDVETAPSPDKLGKDMPKSEPADEGDDDGDHMMAVSALHDFASAFGLKVHDEGKGLKALYDLMKCAPTESEPEAE